MATIASGAPSAVDNAPNPIPVYFSDGDPASGGIPIGEASIRSLGALEVKPVSISWVPINAGVRNVDVQIGTPPGTTWIHQDNKIGFAQFAVIGGRGAQHIDDDPGLKAGGNFGWGRTVAFPDHPTEAADVRLIPGTLALVPSPNGPRLHGRPVKAASCQADRDERSPAARAACRRGRPLRERPRRLLRRHAPTATAASRWAGCAADLERTDRHRPLDAERRDGVAPGVRPSPLFLVGREALGQQHPDRMGAGAPRAVRSLPPQHSASWQLTRRRGPAASDHLDNASTRSRLSGVLRLRSHPGVRRSR